MDAFEALVVGAAAALDTGASLEGGVDLFQLDAVALMLDLVVRSPVEEELPALAYAHEVSGAVYGFRQRSGDGVRHEGALRASGVGVVAERDVRAAHIELAHLSGLANGLHAFVQHQDAAVAERLAQGQAVEVGAAAIHDVVEAVAGDLGRPVEVREGCLGQVL